MTLRGEAVLQPDMIGKAHRNQLLIPRQQMGHRAFGNNDAAALQFRVNVWDALVLAVAHRANKRDHIQPEFAMGQGSWPSSSRR
jgi:hypothetical protein